MHSYIFFLSIYAMDTLFLVNPASSNKQLTLAEVFHWQQESLLFLHPLHTWILSL